VATIEKPVVERRFEHLVLDFLAYLEFERGLSRNTLDAYRTDLLQFGCFLGERDVSALEAKPGDVADFLEALARGGGLGPAWLGEQLLHLPAREHLGQLARAPRCAQRGGGVSVEEPLAAQVSVEGAQAGALAVDRRGRGRGACGCVAVGRAPRGELLEEVRDVARRGVQRRAVPFLEKAPVLQQVGAVCVERVTRQATLELEVRQEVEDEVLEAPLDDWLFDGGHW